MTFALTTAFFAAKASAEGLKSGDLAGALVRYEAAHRQLYRSRAWVNTLVRWVLTTPRHAVRLLRPLHRVPAVLSFLSSRVHGR